MLGAAAVAGPVAARAQEPGRIYRLGSLSHNSRRAPFYLALFEGLKTRGFVEGQNLLPDPKGYELRAEQLEEHASEIIKAGVDIIFCGGDAVIRTAQAATRTIPIFAVTDDLIGSGFVHSLAKPEGNTTGTSILATELDGKRQEILLEALSAFGNWRHLPRPTPLHHAGSNNSKKRPACAASSSLHIRCQSLRRLLAQSMPRKVLAPPPSM